MSGWDGTWPPQTIRRTVYRHHTHTEDEAQNIGEARTEAWMYDEPPTGWEP